MIRINLLPHRQARRARLQRQFGLMALIVGVVAAMMVFSELTYLSSKKQTQLDRNARLEKAIAQLDSEIKDIKDLKERINNVLERKQVVENLQSDRSQAVVVLDELSRQLPEGVFLKSIKQTDKQIVVEGVADTNARVATLVRNLSVSSWLESPNLREIKLAGAVNGVKQNYFTLTVNVKTQKTKEAPDKKKVVGAQS